MSKQLIPQQYIVRLEIQRTTTQLLALVKGTGDKRLRDLAQKLSSENAKALDRLQDSAYRQMATVPLRRACEPTS